MHLVHMNLCGSLPEPSLGGCVYVGHTGPYVRCALALSRPLHSRWLAKATCSDWLQCMARRGALCMQQRPLLGQLSRTQGACCAGKAAQQTLFSCCSSTAQLSTSRLMCRLAP